MSEILKEWTPEEYSVMCPFCGQYQMIEAASEDQAKRLVAMACKCEKGRVWRGNEVIIERAIFSMEHPIDVNNFPVPEPEAVDLVKEALECVGGKKVKKISITIGKAVISATRSNGGQIKYKRAVSLEDPAGNAE